jgi:hypothetical protein
MRPAALAITAALILAGIAGQNAVLRSTEANNSHHVINCPGTTGTAVQGACSPVSLDSLPASILSHSVLVDACPGADLHVVEYVPEDATSATPLVAKWCG